MAAESIEAGIVFVMVLACHAEPKAKHPVGRKTRPFAGAQGDNTIDFAPANSSLRWSDCD